jgi:hypothetical protein
LSVCVFASNDCTFVDRGTVHVGIEASCWMFQTESGAKYQIVGGPNWIYTEGLTGVLAGNINKDLMSNCQMGPVVEVCGFEADSIVNLVGTLSFSAERGNVWILTVGNREYRPICYSKSFYLEGAKVKVKGILRGNDMTTFKVADVVDVFEYNVIQTGKNKTPGADDSARCHSDYASCRKICSENYCFVSCETLFSACLAGK